MQFSAMAHCASISSKTIGPPPTVRFLRASVQSCYVFVPILLSIVFVLSPAVSSVLTAIQVLLCSALFFRTLLACLFLSLSFVRRADVAVDDVDFISPFVVTVPFLVSLSHVTLSQSHSSFRCHTLSQSLLTDPNPASPANGDAAVLYAKDRKAYKRKVRACVERCTG